MGMLKKAASGVLALLPCSRTRCTLRLQHKGHTLRDAMIGLRPTGPALLQPAALPADTARLGAPGLGG